MTFHTGTVGMEPAGTRAHRHLIAVTLEVRLEIFCHEPSARQSSFGMVIPPSEIVIRWIEKIEIIANIFAYIQLSSKCFYL